MQVPQITLEHWNKGLDFSRNSAFFSMLDAINKAIEIALAEQSQEPHTGLKALYEQQVKNGTTGFYLWEFLHLKTNEWRVIPADEPPLFINLVKYRCTPKPTCQVRNDDTGELKTMTREAAKLLQAETKDMCDWFMPNKTEIGLHYEPVFKADGIYTYKLKANIVKLDGKLMSREAAIAEWESKKDTCDVWYSNKGSPRWDISESPNFDKHNNSSSFGEYQLRAKPLKQVSWKSVPVGVMTNKGELRKVYLARVSNQLQATIEATKLSDSSLIEHYEYECSELELAPASEQPWIAVQDDRSILGLCREFDSVGLTYEFDKMRYRITGIAEGYKLK